jgi:hypothetical protein
MSEDNRYDENDFPSGDYLEYLSELESERVQKAQDDFFEWEGHY